MTRRDEGIDWKSLRVHVDIIEMSPKSSFRNRFFFLVEVHFSHFTTIHFCFQLDNAANRYRSIFERFDMLRICLDQNDKGGVRWGDEINKYSIFDFHISQWAFNYWLNSIRNSNKGFVFFSLYWDEMRSWESKFEFLRILPAENVIHCGPWNRLVANVIYSTHATQSTISIEWRKSFTAEQSNGFQKTFGWKNLKT